jgi:hypothetical protein
MTDAGRMTLDWCQGVELVMPLLHHWEQEPQVLLKMLTQRGTALM